MDCSMDFTFAIPSGGSDSRQGSPRRYSNGQWEHMKPTIQHPYINQNRTAKEIISTLKEAEFVVSPKQLEDRLRKWKINTKNIKETDMLEIARVRLKRTRLQAKASAIYVHENLVQDSKIDRFVKRNNISESALLSMTSPVDVSTPAFTVLTPPASSCEDEDEQSSCHDDVSASSTPFRSSMPTSLCAANLHPAASYPATSYPSMMQAAACYPKSSSFSYWENPDNLSANYWREPRTPALELSPPPPSEWAQKNPNRPTAGLFDPAIFDFSQYHEDFQKENGGHCGGIAEDNLYLLPQRRYFSEEEDSCRERLAIAEQELGPENEDTLDAMRNLAFVFYKQGRYEHSETLLHRVVEIGQKVFGNDNLATLETRLHLSIAIQEQGRYLETEDLQRQVLDSFTKIVGKKDKHTLQTQLSLAVCLMCQKKFEKAASLQHEVLNICNETLGGMDSFTLQTMGDLALSHIRLGALRQSVKMRRIELKEWKALKGEFHPQTMVAKLLFAIALSEEGDHRASKIIADDIYLFRKNEIGTEHPDTLRVAAHLAFCLSKQGCDSEALEIYQSIWMTKKKVLGKTHPDTLQSLRDIALHYERQVKHQEAERLFEQVLETRRQVLISVNDRDALRDLSHIATSIMLQGHHKEAEFYLREVLIKSTATLPLGHPDIFDCEKSIAIAVAYQWRYTEAESILQDTLTRCVKTLGDEHLTTRRIMAAIASVLKQQGRFRDAVPVLRELLKIKRKVLGENHPSTLCTDRELVSSVNQM